MRKIVSLVVAVFVLGILGVPSAAAHPSITFYGKTIFVDTSRAGQLPVNKAIADWNAGLRAGTLAPTNICNGPGCIHVVEVSNGPTFLCTNPYECGSSGGRTDGSCTVEVDRSAIQDLPRRQFGNANVNIKAFLEHGLGHVITGTWPTDGSMGFDCAGLGHDTRCTSIMQSPFGLCGVIPAKPDAINYAEADALIAAYTP